VNKRTSIWRHATQTVRTNTSANRALSSDKAPQTMLQLLQHSVLPRTNIKSTQIFNCQTSELASFGYILGATHRNRFTASAHTHLGVQALPAVVELPHQPPIRVHDAKARDVNGTKFDYLALPAIVHNLQYHCLVLNRNWVRRGTVGQIGCSIV